MAEGWFGHIFPQGNANLLRMLINDCFDDGPFRDNTLVLLQLAAC